MDSLFSNFDKKKQESNTSRNKSNKISKELILKHINFELEADNDTLSYLEDQTYKLHNTYSKAATDLGKIFFETQQKLSSHYSGIFEKWYTSLGFAKKTVYRYIDRYNLIESCQNDTTKILIESLPLTLSYEISKENTNEELKDMVLNGEIKTLKEYKEYLDVLDKEKNKNIIDYGEIDADVFKERINALEKTQKRIKESLKELPEDLKYKIYKEVEKFEKKIGKLIGNQK